jgi:DNA mismatch repair protein MutS2
MDEHTFRVLEFDKVLDMAAVFAVTTPGKYVVQNTRPLSSIEDIRRHVQVVSECFKIMAEERTFGIEHFDDLIPLFQKVRPANAVLDPKELRSFLPFLNSALNLCRFSEAPSCPGLGAIVLKLVTQSHIREAIERAINRDWEIRDNASPALSSIRSGIRFCEDRIRKILEGILKQTNLTTYIQDFYLAQRNKRWVIPVKRDFKSHIPGVVHDISNTGVTVYVEPYSIQPIGNELDSLRAEEKLEEYRILQSIAHLIREHLPDIEEDYRIIAEVDALQSMAGFSKEMEMSPPEINEKGYMKIIRGRHPLLFKTLKREKQEGKLIPLDIEIGRENSCMVITGSNTGGKTVSLKTIGVLTLMALSGMHIPAGTGTEISFLKSVLADIGDEQSIEQNLSTFSAHITRISGIISRSRDLSMVIIDELGTGTDPGQGGALSCAILRRLKQQGALTLVSTHLGMLKAFAHSEPGIVNAAMEMEETSAKGVTTYRPTYKLVMGEPGTSHAFEIAESLGLDAGLIKEARDFTRDEGGRIEPLITDLKQKNREFDKRLKESEDLKRESELLRSQLKEEIMSLETREKERLTKELREAEEIVRKAKREAREIIENLKRASLEKAKDALKELDKKIKEIETSRKELSTEEIKRIGKVKEGQRVYVMSIDRHGTVHSINEKRQRCKVAVEGKKIDVALSDLSEPVKDAERGRETSPPALFETSVDINMPYELKVIGQRVDPALSIIERYLNDASIAGHKEVKIIHGIGEGILASAIGEYLTDHPLVESFRKGSEGEGGEAVTMVLL